jgi:hypothetical protein
MGWTTLPDPKYGKPHILDALMRLLKYDGSYATEILRYDAAGEISKKAHEDAIAVIDGTFNFKVPVVKTTASPPVVSVVPPEPPEVLGMPYFFKSEAWARQAGTRNKSKSSRKSGLNLAEIRKSPPLKKQLNALEYQASRVAELTLELELATTTLDKMKLDWLKIRVPQHDLKLSAEASMKKVQKSKR